MLSKTGFSEGQLKKQDLGKRSNVISSAVITSADTAEGVAHGETNITLESNHEH